MPLIIFIMLTKLNALILGCIFLFVTPIMASDDDSESSDPIMGPQTARIIVPRAIVYSDESMNSPLGYISNDKLVKVGNPRKKNPALVPLVIYGRLAFIEAKNIHYENESMELYNSRRGAPREHNIDDILIRPEEKLSMNNSAYLDLHQYSAGEQTSNLFDSIEGVSKQNFVGLGVYLIHRQLKSPIFWGAGYEYSSISSSNISFNTYTIAPTVGYTPMRNQLFLVDLSLSLDFASGQIKIKNNYSDEPAAFIYGPQISSRIVFFPEQKYHVTGSLGLRSYKVLGIETLPDANDLPINGISLIKGINLAIGFAIEI